MIATPQKQEKKMCGMAQMYSWLKTLYGDSDDFNWSQFGLPQDKVKKSNEQICREI